MRTTSAAAVKNVADAVGVAGRVVPKLLKTKAEIAAAPIDHRAGFLLAHIDGVTSVAGLVDICGMPEEEVDADPRTPPKAGDRGRPLKLVPTAGNSS